MWEPVTPEGAGPGAALAAAFAAAAAAPAAVAAVPRAPGIDGATLRRELPGVRRWLLAKKGWREDAQGKPVPPGAKEGLDLRGLYEYIRERAPLFQEFLDDPDKGQQQSSSSGSSNCNGSGSKPATAPTASTKGTKGKAASSSAAAAANTLRKGRGGRGAGGYGGAKAQAPTTKAAASGTAAGKKRAAPPATVRSPPPPPPPEAAVVDLSAAIPSEMSVRLEEACGDDGTLLQYFATAPGAWSGLFRRLLAAEKRLTMKGGQKFAFKYGRTAQETRIFDRQADLLRWLLNPGAHPPMDPQVLAAAPPVTEEEALLWRGVVLDWLWESGAAPFKDSIRGAMQAKLPAPPSPSPSPLPAEAAAAAAGEEEEEEEEEEGGGSIDDGSAKVPPPPPPSARRGRPPRAPKGGDKENSKGAAAKQQKPQQAAAGAAASKATAAASASAATAAAASLPDPSKPLKARPLLRPGVGAKRKRAVALAQKADPSSSASSSASGGGAFVQTVQGAERFFGQKHHAAKGGGLAAPAALVQQIRKLDLPSVQEVRSIVASLVPTHSDERKQLEARYARDFPAWVDDLQAGFNLLLYGVGSKRALLDRFAELLRKEGYVAVVDGLDGRAARAGPRLLEIAAEYGHGPPSSQSSSGGGGCVFSYGAAGDADLLPFAAMLGVQQGPATVAENGEDEEPEDDTVAPAVAARSVAASGGGGLGQRRTNAARACKTAAASASRHANPEIPLFLVIHSLDSRALTSGAGGKATLEALVELADRPGVHIVASVDHLNSPLLFSARHLEALSLVWHDVTTLRPYGGGELAGAQGGDALLHGRGGQTLLPAGEGLRYLLQCVTRRHLELLQFLAARQLEEEEAAAAARKRRKSNPGGEGGGGGGGDDGRGGKEREKEETGITFEDLAAHCASKLISRSHGNLRQLFDELLDHRLLKSKGIGTQTRYWIPRSTQELRMIVAYKG